MSRLYASGLAGLLALTVAACGSSGSNASSSSTATSASATSASATSASAAPASIAISGYAFVPAHITVAPGTKVTFTNHDQTAHTATTNAAGFDTGTVKPGGSASVVLTKPGIYTYYCQFHAFMHGLITVR